ncbi:hypothetical protein ACHRV5_16590 [Flavobacterium sp. FlaQc-52]|jgi:hypothetical protein|uniref:DUF4625 domain-containing protein n=1 Tax=Flavobacterium cupriresistens TaxID=2893885 RepID=A0ABU4RIA7_9FLAO|nr:MULTISPECIES: hypothetical protein [unclassified Flavobacterium]MDX6191245.1 hypothetical protein [Flavobacterium sp. Fl-318]UFH42436.1 hypothetical protein LNP23_21835 [Flavobacterium sp. F-323]
MSEVKNDCIVPITSFTPIQGPIGTVITAIVPSQEVIVDPDGYSIVGTFTGEGGTSFTADADVLDWKKCTKFSITVPENLEKGHLYSFKIKFTVLFEDSKGGTYSETFVFESASPFLVTLV